MMPTDPAHDANFPTPRAAPDAGPPGARRGPSPDARGLDGVLLASKYRLVRVIGEGGMGAVYEAEHVEIGRRVAVKLVHAVHGRQAEMAERFRREARAAGAVESEHIVQVFDVGCDPDHGLFMVMELLRGQDLGALLAERGRLEPLFACQVARQVALALAAAHAAGVVHRDLKPANIFLARREDGSSQVKLVDFGIAKVVREADRASAALTRAGLAMGTPQYMSPEQAQALSAVDHRTDVYSLGTVLFEMLVGAPARPELESYEQMVVHIATTPAPRLRDRAPLLPAALDTLIASMLEHDPARRPASMSDVAARLVMLYPAACARPVFPAARRAPRLALVFDGRTPAAGVPAAADLRERPTARAPLASMTGSALVCDTVPPPDDIPAGMPTRGGLLRVIVGLVAAAGLAGAGWIGLSPSGGSTPQGAGLVAGVSAPPVPDASPSVTPAVSGAASVDAVARVAPGSKRNQNTASMRRQVAPPHPTAATTR